MAGYGRIFNIAGSATVNRNVLSNRSGLPNFQPCAMLNSKTLEKLGIPPKPKRPLTPFFKFMTAHRGRVAKEEPHLKSQDVIRKMAKNWVHHDPAEKRELQRMYDIELLAYSKQIMIYEQSITPEQKKIIQNAKNNAINKTEKLKFKKKTEELGKPKKPPTGFIQYMQEKRFSKSKEEKITDWLCNIAQQWRAMTIEEKSKYKLESQKLMDQYRKDMREWEEKMVREGHIDVVRNQGLLYLKTNVAAKPE